MNTKKVLLIEPPSKEQKPTPLPLGLMYLASYLEKSNHQVKILDMKVEKITKVELKKILFSFKPDFVGIRCLTYESPTAYSIAKYIKSVIPSCRIVFGGPHAGASPQEIIANKNVDYVVIGEGEITISELVSGKKLEQINGILYKEKNKIKQTPPREYIKNLDEMPLPAYHLINIKDYFKSPYAHAFFKAEDRTSQIFTSRGCPFQCIYCHKIFGKSIRFRSPENVLKEILLLYNKYKVREIQIEDDSFNVNIERAKKMMDLIISSGIKIKISFPNGVRGDFIDEELADKMKKAGVYSICFGIESGDKDIQQFIQKNLDLKKVKKAIEIVTKKGILATGYFMIGFLDETPPQMMKTIEFAQKSRLHMATFFKVTPYPNTKLYDLAKERGFKLSNNPEDYTYTFSTMGNLSLSKVSTEELDKIIKKAYFKFFSPIRIIRLGIKAPNKKMLVVNFFRLLFWKN